MEWALTGKALASSAWQVAHCTLAILAGCGNSLMVVWQSLQPRTPWALAACLAGSTEMLFPASDFAPASPWHARHSWSAASKAEGAAKVNDKAMNTKTTRVVSNFNPL